MFTDLGIQGHWIAIALSKKNKERVPPDCGLRTFNSAILGLKAA
jgi:hypothetical protein